MLAWIADPNTVRAAVVFCGGFVVGTGCIVLEGRRRFYVDLKLIEIAQAMVLLMIVNALVLGFIATILLVSQNDEPLSWRWIVASIIFLIKGLFFYKLWRGAMTQERARLYG